jgi:uroporphyrinogen decarboxylase
MFKPCYADLARHCHRLGLSFWLHCCGAVTELLDDFIEMGVDVIHPIQPYAMDQRAVAEKYCGRISFLTGIDVQYLLPQASPEGVAQGTRALIDVFDRDYGGCLLAASNGIMPETPLENIRAWLTTAEAYGAEKRRAYAKR